METHIENVITLFEQGEKSALDAYIEVELIKKSAEAALSKLKEDAVKEAQELGTDNGPVQYKGCKLSRVSSRASYNYKHIQAWVDRKTELSEIEELAKLGAKYNKAQVDTETGEEIPPAIVTTYSKEGLSVKPL